MNSSFFDVSDFVYGLERTGRAPEPVFLDDSMPDQDTEKLEALMNESSTSAPVTTPFLSKGHTPEQLQLC